MLRERIDLTRRPTCESRPAAPPGLRRRPSRRRGRGGESRALARRAAATRRRRSGMCSPSTRSVRKSFRRSASLARARRDRRSAR